QVHDKTPTTCNICGKPLKNQSAFVKHRKSHLGATDLPYTCNACTKGFKERCHLVAHYRNKHHEVGVDTAVKSHLAPEGRSD
uniref:C2H2-type domain-containing protein n=1 Tax=Parascaris univalens TaxID=6257 RepID=A0A915A839_PARUN